MKHTWRSDEVWGALKPWELAHVLSEWVSWNFHQTKANVNVDFVCLWGVPARTKQFSGIEYTFKNIISKTPNIYVSIVDLTASFRLLFVSVSSNCPVAQSCRVDFELCWQWTWHCSVPVSPRFSSILEFQFTWWGVVLDDSRAIWQRGGAGS